MLRAVQLSRHSANKYSQMGSNWALCRWFAAKPARVQTKQMSLDLILTDSNWQDKLGNNASVRLIWEKDGKKGHDLVDIKVALTRAENKRCNVVIVNTKAVPPVVKIMNLEDANRKKRKDDQARSVKAKKTKKQSIKLVK